MVGDGWGWSFARNIERPKDLTKVAVKLNPEMLGMEKDGAFLSSSMGPFFAAALCNSSFLFYVADSAPFTPAWVYLCNITLYTYMHIPLACICKLMRSTPPRFLPFHSDWFTSRMHFGLGQGRIGRQQYIFYCFLVIGWNCIKDLDIIAQWNK